MTGRVAARLAELDVTLPEAVSPAGNYVPWVRHNGLVLVSGQLPLRDGTLVHAGLCGADIDVDEGYAAARLAAINLLAQVRAACDGDLDRVERVVRIGGFVACTAAFRDHPKVVNGASDLMVAVFGDAGKHARAAIGCAALPLGACVEIEGMFAVRE